MIDLIKEFFLFLKYQKKLWMLPIITILIVLGGLLILAEGTVVAPFIYTLI